MKTQIRNAAALLAIAAVTAQVSAQVTFYGEEGFAGRSFTTQRQITKVERQGLADGASSVVVEKDRWEACEEPRFGGRCIVLRPGRYPSFNTLGMVNGALSVRAIGRSARVADEGMVNVAASVQSASSDISLMSEFRTRMLSSQYTGTLIHSKSTKQCFIRRATSRFSLAARDYYTYCRACSKQFRVYVVCLLSRRRLNRAPVVGSALKN